ncbi:MarR family winged helix-turn-helix transcriptional regulator [Micromonospora sp. PLK6-60]|uniref:MarR family winged helix-turn-helix transcriptional regulator n=1 Tax=Micromonospora sp. PLK6-60 TaxID=2873383 RepID=UPI001CA76C48|nr:MarR family winged helix-turn-helix transcriptional regulator [Micromonospora sp. PLK6-60]MBY8871478.1 MarR family winged helix-turn-helix transcriptional regulator [Micromonospora sp. PLK6-60]
MEPLVRFPDVLGHAPLGRLIGIAGHLVEQYWGRYLAERHGLSAAGMRVLMLLARAGDSTHREVAEHCFVRPATLTGIVDTLERDGFVERRRDTADRRTVQLALTDKGREHAEAVLAVMRSDPPLTSVDADPAKREVIREFLTELITTMSDGEGGRLNPSTQEPEEPRPGGRTC